MAVSSCFYCGILQLLPTAAGVGASGLMLPPDDDEEATGATLRPNLGNSSTPPNIEIVNGMRQDESNGGADSGGRKNALVRLVFGLLYKNYIYS